MSNERKFNWLRKDSGGFIQFFLGDVATSEVIGTVFGCSAGPFTAFFKQKPVGEFLDSSKAIEHVETVYAEALAGSEAS